MVLYYVILNLSRIYFRTFIILILLNLSTRISSASVKISKLLYIIFVYYGESPYQPFYHGKYVHYLYLSSKIVGIIAISLSYYTLSSL